MRPTKNDKLYYDSDLEKLIQWKSWEIQITISSVFPEQEW
jgi:hypothetical protein